MTLGDVTMWGEAYSAYGIEPSTGPWGTPHCKSLVLDLTPSITIQHFPFIPKPLESTVESDLWSNVSNAIDISTSKSTTQFWLSTAQRMSFCTFSRLRLVTMATIVSLRKTYYPCFFNFFNSLTPNKKNALTTLKIYFTKGNESVIVTQCAL